MEKIVITLAMAAALSACTTGQPAVKHPTTGMANPASVYCGKLGGKLDMVTTDTGVSGYCTLPGGERIDEWTLYRRDHNT